MVKSNVGRVALVAACAAALLSCDRSPTTARGEVQAPSALEIIDTHWTSAAAERVQELVRARKAEYSLPELRVYNSRQQLIYHAKGFAPGKLASRLDPIISADLPIAGPSLGETIGDLQTRAGSPAESKIKPAKLITVVDYWADWCVPCKALEKELVAWAAKRPNRDIRIVRAEADLTKLMRAEGAKTYMIKKGPDGKPIKVEITG